MSRFVLRRLAGVCACLALSPAFADNVSDPAQLLGRLNDALRSLDYQGVFIYQHDNRLDGLRVYHAGGTTEHERLVSLTGVQREVVRSGGAVTCFQAGTPPLALSAEAGRSLIPLVPFVRAENLGGHYALKNLGADRVAGFAASVVDIEAADGFRYGYRLWLDQSSGLLLRAALIGTNGAPIEQVMFVSLEVGAAPRPQDLAPGAAASPESTASDEDKPLQGVPRWALSNLPAGFALSARTALAATADNRAEHLLVSDGMANVSVYIETGPGVVGASTRGALSVYTRSLAGHSITVLGDVPPATVERIGSGLQQVAATH